MRPCKEGVLKGVSYLGNHDNSFPKYFRLMKSPEHHICLVFFPSVFCRSHQYFQKGETGEEPGPDLKSRCLYTGQGAWGQGGEKERAAWWRRGEGGVLMSHLSKITKDRSQAATLNSIRSHRPTTTCNLVGRRVSWVITLNSSQRCIQNLWAKSVPKGWLAVSNAASKVF